MSKKNITLILILTFFLSVLVLAIIGKAAERAGTIPAEQLVFSFDADANANENYTIKYENEFKVDEEITMPCFTVNVDKEYDSEITISFTAEIKPSDTTDDVLVTAFVGLDSSLSEEELLAKTPKLEETTVKVLKEGSTDEYELNPVHTYTITFSADQRNVVVDLKFTFNTGGYPIDETLRFSIIEQNESSEIIDFGF